MHSEVKMSDNGRSNIFIEKQTTKKVPVILLDMKLLTKR